MVSRLGLGCNRLDLAVTKLAAMLPGATGFGTSKQRTSKDSSLHGVSQLV